MTAYNVPPDMECDHAEALRLCAEDLSDQIDADIIAELIRQHAGGKGRAE